MIDSRKEIAGATALFLGIVVAIAGVGCGRSDLTDYGDAGSDAASCGPTTCPTGCCDAHGMCHFGVDLNACGFGGVACNDCLAEGFQFCDSQLKACANLQPTCDSSNCASGCCSTFNGQNACVSGQSSLGCGTGGNACTNCTMTGEVCASQQCVSAPCGPISCSTCCSSGACVGTQSESACGTNGVACTDCASEGEFCNQSTGKCATASALCNPTSCPNGCCANDICVTTEPDTQCGLGGVACADCTATSATCTSGVCAPPCTLTTCPGCCSANTCFAGFLDTQCGSGGASCADCVVTSETCDIVDTPRVCEMVACPADYSGCATSVTTTALTVSNVCSASDIANAKAACSSGFDSASCQSFFAAEPKVNAACASCLAPFQYDIPTLIGIFNCVSPYLGTSCLHTTGCSADCEEKSCALCSPSAQASCINDVIAISGQCYSYLSSSLTCIGIPLGTSASFCDGVKYLGNYGDWLGAVGAHYCE